MSDTNTRAAYQLVLRELRDEYESRKKLLSFLQDGVPVDLNNPVMKDLQRRVEEKSKTLAEKKQ